MNPREPTPTDHHGAIREVLTPKLVAPPLRDQLAGAPQLPRDLIIDCNVDYPDGLMEAKDLVRQWVRQVGGDAALARDRGGRDGDFVFARLTGPQLDALLALDGANAKQKDAARDGSIPPTARRNLRAIFHVWPSNKLQRLTTESIRTVKADAAHASFRALGNGVVWAVLDSGIDKDHPHFALHDNVLRAPPLAPKDFSGAPGADPLADPDGHGTHVAGIIAGTMPADGTVVVAANEPTGDGLPAWGARVLEPGRSLTSMAPRTRLVSLRVLDENGNTSSSVVIAALDYVREVNADGRRAIHGVNLSLGCDWYPDEYAAGQSPLCVTVDELVAGGVVVVVSAGNSGAGGTLTGASGDVTGQLSTITDPGNAERAITVGSSHRFAPHTYGVSYTSSKGPTLDGRLKPDLVAPGERITSAATGAMRERVPVFADCAEGAAPYVEESGTSMAAPHVSGAIAAFLSVRPEFIGHADEIKRLFCANATSLGRHEFYQGAGLLDLMRVLSNV